MPMNTFQNTSVTLEKAEMKLKMKQSKHTPRVSSFTAKIKINLIRLMGIMLKQLKHISMGIQ